MRDILKMCLASVVYHSEFLRDQLPQNHKLLTTALFRDNNLLEILRLDVECRLARPAEVMRPTGIPPHVNLLSNMSQILNEVMSVPDIVSNRIITILEERAIGAGTVTRDGLRATLQQAIEDSGILRLVRRMEQPEERKDPALEDENRFRNFEWGGSIHAVPEQFAIPSVNCIVIFQFWCCGDPANGIVPFRRLRADDMPNRNVRKRLSDLYSLMKILEDRASTLSIEIPHRISIAEANRLYEHLKGAIEVQELSENANRKRRRAQLSWRTVHNELSRKRRRVEQEIPDGDGAEEGNVYEEDEEE